MKSKRGQALVEYILIIALISVIGISLVKIHSCKDANKNENNTCNSRPKQGSLWHLCTIWQNRVNEPQQTTNNETTTSVNPMFQYGADYICTQTDEY